MILDVCFGPDRSRRLKPYSFFPYRGEAFLRAYAEARQQWRSRLEERDPRPAGLLARAEEGPATRADPAVRRGLDQELEEQWRAALEAAGSVDAGVWCERIARAHMDAGLPLCDEFDDARWSFDAVQSCVDRFEAFGCLHRDYDARWRRVRRDPNRVSTLVRFALAVAWAGRSATDPAVLAGMLNALLKVDDLVQALVTHDGIELDPDEAGCALAAVTIEEELVRALDAHARAMNRKEAS